MSFINLAFNILILLLSLNCFPNCVVSQLNSTQISVVTQLNSTPIFHGTPRVKGGYRPSKKSLSKYVVSIRRQEETETRFGYTHFCAGSIIAKNKILTAAHCFYRKYKKFSSSGFKVVAKTPNRLNKNSKTVEINIERVILHPDYAEDTIFNDIAVLILETDIWLESDSAAIIPLTKVKVKSETLCQVIGWGRLYKHGPLANEILHVDLYVHSREYCRKLYPHFSGKKLCASGKDDKEKDACNGDSGGPLICAGALTGIVSYGYGCGSGHAGIYTNVFKYLDWIDNNGKTLLRPSLFFIIANLLFIYLSLRRSLNMIYF